MRAKGFAANNSFTKLKPFEFTRHDPKDNEVGIEILHCGVCHSDVHQVKNEWHNTIYPCIPGHEIVGKVRQVGKKVKRFKVGQLVGVGCMVNACLECDNCQKGLEQYCTKGFTATYNGNQRNPTEASQTYGGYSNFIVVHEHFVLKIPKGLTAEAAAPILCAGVTTYSPLKHWKVKRGSKVGIAGFGGLGHMAAKIALAMGAEVTMITSSKDKVRKAKLLGVDHVILSTDKKQMQRHKGTLDIILNTLPQPHDPNPYSLLLKTEGNQVIVGCIAPLKKPLDMSQMNIDRKSLTSTLIGGIKETQEVLNFCAKHQITPDVKSLDIRDINLAHKELDKGQASWRYVIDMRTIHEDADPGLIERLVKKIKP